MSASSKVKNPDEEISLSLSRELKESGASMEICICDDSAFVFTYKMRMAANDVDFEVVEMNAIDLEAGIGENRVSKNIKELVGSPGRNSPSGGVCRRVVAEYPDRVNPSLRISCPDIKYVDAIKRMAQNKQGIKSMSKEFSKPREMATNKKVTVESGACTRQHSPTREEWTLAPGVSRDSEASSEPSRPMSIYGYPLPRTLDDVVRAEESVLPLRFREWLDYFYLGAGCLDGSGTGE